MHYRATVSPFDTDEQSRRYRHAIRLHTGNSLIGLRLCRYQATHGPRRR